MEEPSFDYQFRLILIGDSMVGKSSLLRYFTDGKFSDISDPTVGVDFYARFVQLENGTRIKLQLWDTAGQERFRAITKSYYRNSVGVMLAYDITQQDSFARIPDWMSEAKKHIHPYKPVFILVGCKSDLSDSETVSEEDAIKFAQNCKISYVRTSAKTGDNVEKAFRLMAEEIHERMESGELRGDDETWEGIKKGFRSISNRDLPVAEPVSKCC